MAKMNNQVHEERLATSRLFHIFLKIIFLALGLYQSDLMPS